MKRYGLVYHPKIAEAAGLTREAREQLVSMGAEVWSASAYDEEALDRQATESDIVITFGGDGTIVRTARFGASRNLAILGVNLGRLGFLSEMQPWELPDKLEALVKGEYWLESRMMLHANVEREGKVIHAFEAVNDVVVCRGMGARIVRVGAYIDGQLLTQYAADGVIVATPTGSTAYSLAAGGPIVDPRLNDMVVTPIAPHLSVASALVLPASTTVRLELSTDHEATCTVDGQIDAVLQNGDVTEVTESSRVCRFVRLGESGRFYRTLLARLK